MNLSPIVVNDMAARVLLSSSFTDLLKKQLLERFCKRRCFEKILKIQRKTFLLGSPFNKASYLQARNFIKWLLQHRFFPVKFARFLVTTILKNIWELLRVLFLGFIKLNHDVVLWLSWRYRFLYNEIYIVKNTCLYY